MLFYKDKVYYMSYFDKLSMTLSQGHPEFIEGCFDV